MPGKKDTMTTATSLSVAEKLEKILAGIGPVERGKSSPPRFTHLTGTMLRELVNSGAVVIRGADEPWDYDSDIFKGGHDEESLAVLEKFPRFFAQGFIDEENATISIETIWAAEKVQGEGSVTVTLLVPKLTKAEILAFANRFHRADEFEIGDGFAHAWFD
jgi:hypothetical protein